MYDVVAKYHMEKNNITLITTRHGPTLKEDFSEVVLAIVWIGSNGSANPGAILEWSLY